MKLQCLSVRPPVCLQGIISETIGGLNEGLWDARGTQEITISYKMKDKRIVEMRPHRKRRKLETNIIKSGRMWSGFIWLRSCWSFGLLK
jgi:hypothetical protein